MAARGFRIILACRDLDKAEKVMQEIEEQTENPHLQSVHLDLAVFRSVPVCVSTTLQAYGIPDIIINNAGVFNNSRVETVDGLEQTMAVNYYGPFLLTMLFIPELKAAAKPVRIINVSSKAALYAALDMDNLSFKRRYHSFKAYGASKLALLYFTRELSKRLLDTQIVVNAAHPGRVNTNIWDIQPNLIATVMRKLSLTPEEGARTSVYLSSSPDVAEVTGKFFYQQQVIPYNVRSSDQQLQNDLWNHSLQVVKQWLP